MLQETNQDLAILRQLASRYAAAAQDARNGERLRLHRAVNDLRPIRPILLIDEIPWNEMNHDGSLTLRCQDPFFREAERRLRRCLYQWEHLPGDLALPPYLGVEKVIHTTGIGVEVLEETRATDEQNIIVSHKYYNQFQQEADLDKLHEPVITYDAPETHRRYERLANAVGDLLPVKITGHPTGYDLGCKTWDIIATCMGIDDLLYNLVDRPDFMHRLVQRFTDIFLSTLRQYEALNLLDCDALAVHSASAAAGDLHPELADRRQISAKNVWGRGLAQILSAVSPAMHEEFDIAYMKRAMEPFGLVYYGCCEPLDRKISILEQIPHLRKISISPWADIRVAAEAVGGRYVLSAKPTPALLATWPLDREAVGKELAGILDACAQYGCPCEILLKDISTVGFHPENLFQWVQLATEMVQNP